MAEVTHKRDYADQKQTKIHEMRRDMHEQVKKVLVDGKEFFGNDPKIASKNLPGTSAQITFAGESPPMPPTPGNYALLATLDSVTRALGYGPTEALDPGLRGAGDISFVGQYADALDGLGVVGKSAHTPDETLNLKSIPKATIRAAVLINRLAHTKKTAR